MTKVADDVLRKAARQQAEILIRLCNGGLSPERFFHYTRQLLNIFLVAIVHREWAKAVEAGDYDSQHRYFDPEFTLEDLQELDEAEVKCEIDLQKKYDTTTTQAWRDSLDNNPASKYRFAHPLKVLAIGYDETTKDQQRDGPIFTTWISHRTGQRWYLILGGDSDRRSLLVGRGSPGVDWMVSFRAAVVAKVLKSSGN